LDGANYRLFSLIGLRSPQSDINNFHEVALLNVF